MEARERRDPRVLAVIVAMSGHMLLGALATYLEAAARDRTPERQPVRAAPACSAPSDP